MKLPLLLGAMSAANIGLTFLYQWFVLVTLGPGAHTDALFGGMTLVQFAIVISTTSLMHVLVPLLTGPDEDHRRREAWGFAAIVGGLALLLAVVLWVTASAWVPLTVPGFDPATRALTVELARIQLPGMVFAAVNAVQWAAYRARQRFVWSELTPLLSASTALLLLHWGLPRYGVVAAAWIGTLRWALQTALLLPGLGAPVKPDLGSGFLREAWRRLRPLLLGTVYYKTDPLVDRFLLSSAGSGSVSLYYLAQQIYGAANQVINRAFAVPFVPRVSLLHAAGDAAGIRRAYRLALFQVGGLSALGVAGLVVVGRPILGLLVGYGKMAPDRVHDLWWVMIWLAGMFVGGALGQISSCAFYAQGDTRTPTRLGMLSYTLHLPAKVALFHLFGVPGLAVASSAYYLVSFGLQHHRHRAG